MRSLRQEERERGLKAVGKLYAKPSTPVKASRRKRPATETIFLDCHADVIYPNIVTSTTEGVHVKKPCTSVLSDLAADIVQKAGRVSKKAANVAEGSIPGAPTEVQSWSAGFIVELMELQKKSELNGTFAKILQAPAGDGPADRYLVELLHEGKQISVKRENLRPAPNSTYAQR
jgi:hypothetical protein